MKRLINRLTVLTLLALVALGSVCCSGARMSRSERKAIKQEKVWNTLKTGKFTIAVTQIDNVDALSFNSTYFIKIDEGVADVYLPYIGQAYYMSFDHNGIYFTEPAMDNKLQILDGGMYTLSFNVRAGEEFYKFFIEISDSGYCKIYLTPMNKQAIIYRGELITNVN